MAEPGTRRQMAHLMGLILAAVTLGAFWQVQHHDFVNFDDYRYVLENPQVRDGLTWEGISWALRNFEAGFWHPLTWISHMVDCELYGLNPQGHHLNSLLLHIANTLCLFLLLRSMTGALWRSGFVALLFALHPLHVEPVAWVSSRKDVLSTLFWILTLLAYLGYTRAPGTPRYLLVLALFSLGLMAKPMLVTLPFVLLLLDFWPLHRTPLELSRQGGPEESRWIRAAGWPRLIAEKLPLLALSFFFVLLTFYAERRVGALPSLQSFPLGTRLAGVLVSYVTYLARMLWPCDLSPIYLHPGHWAAWQVAGSGALLTGLSLGAALTARQRPYIPVGWLWYLGTLVPVIGLVQIGSHALADRYTYVPLIGPFLIVAWGFPDLLGRWRYRREALAVLALTAAALLGTCAWRQTRYWRDSVRLFERAVEVSKDNYLAQNHLGFVLALKGELARAVHHYRQAVQANPGYADAHYNLANALERLGETEDAMQHYAAVLQIHPDYERPHYKLANIFFREGRNREAIEHYEEALRINPADARAHNNLGLALEKEGRIQEALTHYAEALRVNPGDQKARHNLEAALKKTGR